MFPKRVQVVEVSNEPTEPDECRRFAQHLSPQQEAAVDLLATGRNLTDVGRRVGVTRQTVSEWANRNPAFQAALKTRRQELWFGLADRLWGMRPKALDVLEWELDYGNLKAAVEVLKATGMYGLPKPDGPTDPQEAEAIPEEKEDLSDGRGSIRTERT